MAAIEKARMLIPPFQKNAPKKTPRAEGMFLFEIACKPEMRVGRGGAASAMPTTRSLGRNDELRSEQRSGCPLAGSAEFA
jgi:hypothetical protein